MATDKLHKAAILFSTAHLLTSLAHFTSRLLALYTVPLQVGPVTMATEQLYKAGIPLRDICCGSHHMLSPLSSAVLPNTPASATADCAVTRAFSQDTVELWHLMTSFVTAHTLTLCQHTAPDRQASPMILLLLNLIVCTQKPPTEGESVVFPRIDYRWWGPWWGSWTMSGKCNYILACTLAGPQFLSAPSSTTAHRWSLPNYLRLGLHTAHAHTTLVYCGASLLQNCSCSWNKTGIVRTLIEYTEYTEYTARVWMSHSSAYCTYYNSTQYSCVTTNTLWCHRGSLWFQSFFLRTVQFCKSLDAVNDSMSKSHSKTVTDKDLHGLNVLQSGLSNNCIVLLRVLVKNCLLLCTFIWWTLPPLKAARSGGFVGNWDGQPVKGGHSGR